MYIYLRVGQKPCSILVPDCPKHGREMQKGLEHRVLQFDWGYGANIRSHTESSNRFVALTTVSSYGGRLVFLVYNTVSATSRRCVGRTVECRRDFQRHTESECGLFVKAQSTKEID